MKKLFNDLKHLVNPVNPVYPVKKMNLRNEPKFQLGGTFKRSLWVLFTKRTCLKGIASTCRAEASCEGGSPVSSDEDGL